MRVVFMGTPDFAVPALQALLAGHEVAAVVTQPDRPQGRGKTVQFSPVKKAALEAGLKVYQPARVREPEFIEKLKSLQPEAIVVAAFGQMIPKEILTMPRYGCINIHASLLPKYRGAAPIQWAVIDGEPVSGVSTMQMNEGLDTGDILLTQEVPLAPDETGGSLFAKLSVLGAELLQKTLDGLERNTIVPVPQPKESPTAYASMLTRQTGRIDWSRSAEEIERLVRGLNPWPSAYTYLNEKTLKIWKAHVRPGGKDAPGTVSEVTGTEIGVQTGDGLLIVEELQLEGKKRMAADAFLRGFCLEAGTRLE